MSFADLKKNRRSQIEKLVTEAEKVSGAKKVYNDDNLWKPQVDKSGNGYAVIRFLPAKGEDQVPWVQYWDHGFQGPTGRWYIEKSLTSINQPDPVSDLNTQLWNSGNDDDKQTARAQKRRLHYVSNIYVVSDPANPENEGKVFMYEYGKKIFDKIMDVMKPQFEDEQPLNPFDFWEGADFKLKMRQVDGYRNYDKSEFASPAPLMEDDADLEEIYNSLHDITEYINPKNYKTYNVLLKKLNTVLGEVPIKETSEVAEETPAVGKSIDDPIESEDSIDVGTPMSSDEDEDMENFDSFFEKLAAED
jgi:hypothetical protein